MGRKKKQEPKATVNKEELKVKYGDKKVMVIPGTLLINEYGKNGLKEGFTHVDKLEYMFAQPLRTKIRAGLIPMLRYEAECDPSFKQVIPYVVVRHEDKIFCMKRIGGDVRLVGMCSIGTGGHIDEGETLYDGLYRELKEEIGLTDENIYSNEFIGFIYSTATEVDSVHLGMVFFCWVNDPVDIKCLEKDKLVGEWVTIPDLNKLNDEGKLESWTKIVLEQVLKEN